MPLIPEEAALVGVIGGSWDATWRFWADEQGTVPFDLAVYDADIRLAIDGFTALTEGAGLSVTPSAGSIVAELAPSVTADVLVTSISRWRLRCAKSDGTVDFLSRGIIVWEQP